MFSFLNRMRSKNEILQRKLKLAEEVVGTAQGLLLAWNILDLPRECLLHKHLRKVMIEYREKLAQADGAEEGK